MDQKTISESSFKYNGFRDESLKSFSSQKFCEKEINPKKQSKFKTINNSKEILIFSKKDLNEINLIKPKLIKAGLPSVFNIIEKRHSSYDRKKKNSEQTFSNSNIHINIQRKDESPIIKINEYSSNTEQKGFKNYNKNIKFNNYFRGKDFSPPPKLINPTNDCSKHSEIIMISEMNGEDVDAKNRTSFSDLEAKASSIRNKTIATNYSSVGFGTNNENNNYFNESANKFNPWNLNNNLNNVNKNQIANLYQKQFLLNKDSNKKYDNIYIENKFKNNNNKSNKNQVINKINLNIFDRTKRSPSETRQKNNDKNKKEEILDINKNKRIITHQNEEGVRNNSNYYSHDNKTLRKNNDNKNITHINLNEGISYKILNGYKYYFNLPNVDIYLLKDIQISLIQKYKQHIRLWKNKYNEEPLHIKILDIKKSIPENKYTIIMEHPIGGENLTNFINSIGFSEEKVLIEIISKIYNNIIYFQNDNFYYNTLFCLCDIFLDVSGQIKIIPPIIRKLSGLEDNKKCICKYYLDKINSIFNINCSSNFCLGFAIIQLVTQNLIFKMKSFDKIINNKDNKELKKCCLVHTLLTTEIHYCGKKEDLLLSKFLELYPKTLIQFLHDCTSFDGKNANQSFERIMQKREDNTYNEQGTKIQIKELLKLIELPKNKFCKFSEFLYNMEILYKNLDIDSDMFNYSLKKKKIISSLSRAFKIKKEELLKYFLQIIRNNDEKYY